MLRRNVIALIGGSAVAWPLAARAQQSAKVPRVGILTQAENERSALFDAFRKEVRDLGYVEGRTIVLDFRFAKGNAGALAALAAELVRIPVDVIIADSSVVVASEATRTIPIVIATGDDAVALGLAASVARPGGNVTGMTMRLTELSKKRLQLLKQAFPGAAHVSVLLNPTNQSSPAQFRAAEDAAKALGIGLATVAASTPGDVRALGPAALAGADGLMVQADAVFWHHRTTIVALAAAARVPAIYPQREYADGGGLIAYGPSVPDNFRRAADYVDRILRGANPSELPIEEPSKFDFVVNLRTARALGLWLAPDFLVSVDEVIE